MDGDIGRRCILYPPLIGEGVAAECKFQSIPLEDKAHRPIQRMNSRNAADGDAVLLVNDLINALVVELVDLEHLTPYVNISLSATAIPCEHLLHVLYGVGGSELGLVATRTPNPQRYDAIADYPTIPKVCQGAEMVRVKVTDEDLV